MAAPRTVLGAVRESGVRDLADCGYLSRIGTHCREPIKSKGDPSRSMIAGSGWRHLADFDEFVEEELHAEVVEA